MGCNKVRPGEVAIDAIHMQVGDDWHGHEIVHIDRDGVLLDVWIKDATKPVTVRASDIVRVKR
jgi:hypothetical protein